MLVKLIDVFSVSKVGTVAIFERCDRVAVGDKVCVGSQEWVITSVERGDPRFKERVAMVIDRSAKDDLVHRVGSEIEVRSGTDA